MNNKTNTNYTLQYPGRSDAAVDPGTPPWIFGASWTYELPIGSEPAYPAGASGRVGA